MKKLKILLFVIVTSSFYGLSPHNVFAANYPPNAVSNIKVKQIGKESVRISWSMPSTDATHDDVEAYDVLINNGYSKLDLDENSIDVNGNLDFGVKYKVTITAKNNQGSISTSKYFTISSYVEETLINAGDPQSSKNIASQNMHGNYKNNTNTCANCHSVHQAKSSEGLLTRTSAYESCISCHDGSLGFYNVFETNVEKDNGAGTFGGSYEGNMSLHMPTGDMKVENAPGAEFAKLGSGTIDPMFANGHWGKNFTCTSCHNPHGSSSDRLLQIDPNGYSKMERHLVNGVYYGGLITDEIAVGDLNSHSASLYNDINNTVASWLAPVEPNGDDDKEPKDSPKKNYRALKFKFDNDLKVDDKRFNYEAIKYTETNKIWIIQIYKYDKYLGKWIPVRYSSSGPYYGDGVDLLTAPSVKLNGWKTANDPVDPENNEELSEGYLSIGWNGYLVVPEKDKEGNAIAANIAFVKNIATLFDFKFSKIDTGVKTSLNDTVTSSTYKVNHAKYLDDQNKLMEDPNNQGQFIPTDEAKISMSNLNQFNEWCASCHIGFNISKEQKKSLGSTIVYTHHSSSEDDKLPCVQCHYSHGTDATWMKDKNGDSYSDAVTKIVNEYVGKTKPYTGSIGTVTGAGNITELEAQEAAINYLTDHNFSSALKRYSNTASCYRCHGTDVPAN